MKYIPYVNSMEKETRVKLLDKLKHNFLFRCRIILMLLIHQWISGRYAATLKVGISTRPQRMFIRIWNMSGITIINIIKKGSTLCSKRRKDVDPMLYILCLDVRQQHLIQ